MSPDPRPATPLTEQEEARIRQMAIDPCSDMARLLATLDRDRATLTELREQRTRIMAMREEAWLAHGELQERVTELEAKVGRLRAALEQANLEDFGG